MDVRPDGSVMEASEPQDIKALWLMNVTPDGSVMEASEVQPYSRVRRLIVRRGAVLAGLYSEKVRGHGCFGLGGHTPAHVRVSEGGGDALLDGGLVLDS